MKPEPFGLQIDLRSVDVEEMEFSGEIPPQVFEMEKDTLSQPESGLRYEVLAQVAGKELIVQGRLDADFKVLCAKCGEFFSTSVRAPAFLRTYDLSEGIEILDLTPDLREDLLLELPAYPACAEAASGTCPNLRQVKTITKQPDEDAPGGNPWGALDNIQL